MARVFSEADGGDANRFLKSRGEIPKLRMKVEVLGHYVFKLERQSKAREVTHLRLDTFHQTGNRSLIFAATTGR